jgi:hypothetical protein
MADLGYIAEHVPENLILWSSKKLCSKLDNDYHRNTENANASILAELLVRGFLICRHRKSAAAYRNICLQNHLSSITPGGQMRRQFKNPASFSSFLKTETRYK